MKKTQAKPISKTKQAFKTLFASLFNNQAAVDGGRKQPWWIAIILLFVSTLIAIVPQMVTMGKDKGGDIFSSPVVEVDTGLIKFHQALEEKGVTLTYKANDEGVYELNKTGEFNDVFTSSIGISSLTGSVEVPYFSYSALRQKPTTTSEPGFEYENFEYLRVYYTADIADSFTIGTKIVSAARYLDDYLYGLTEDGILINQNPNEKVTSYIILGKTEIRIRLYKPTAVQNGSDSFRNINGLTSKFTSEISINDFYKKTVNGEAISPTDISLVSKVMDNWKHFMDESFKPVKASTFWQTSALFYALLFLLSLFIGVVYWITTRGKYNPNRDIRFLEAMRIGFWLLLSPALITLIVGLFMPNYATMIYIMTLGMRTVWMSMKSVQTQAQ
jgi:hypothetical protein